MAFLGAFLTLAPGVAHSHPLEGRTIEYTISYRLEATNFQSTTCKAVKRIRFADGRGFLSNISHSCGANTFPGNAAYGEVFAVNKTTSGTVVCRQKSPRSDEVCDNGSRTKGSDLIASMVATTRYSAKLQVDRYANIRLTYKDQTGGQVVSAKYDMGTLQTSSTTSRTLAIAVSGGKCKVTAYSEASDMVDIALSETLVSNDACTIR